MSGLVYRVDTLSHHAQGWSWSHSLRDRVLFRRVRYAGESLPLSSAFFLLATILPPNRGDVRLKAMEQCPIPLPLRFSETRHCPIASSEHCYRPTHHPTMYAPSRDANGYLRSLPLRFSRSRRRVWGTSDAPAASNGCTAPNGCSPCMRKLTRCSNGFNVWVYELPNLIQICRTEEAAWAIQAKGCLCAPSPQTRDELSAHCWYL